MEIYSSKRKLAHQASIGGAPVTVASTLSSSLSSAGPSAATAPPQSANSPQSVSYGKRKEVEDVHNFRTGKRKKLESHLQLEVRTVEVGAQAQAWRDVERHAREMAEETEEEHRQLRLGLKILEI